MFDGYWRKRAGELAEQVEALTKAQDALKDGLAGMELRFKERAALVSITRNGRMIRFLFVRNDELIPIETFGTWDSDIAAWIDQLLTPKKTIKGNENGEIV